MNDMTMGQLGAKFKIAADRITPELERKLDIFAQVGVGYVKDEIQNENAVDTGTMLNSTVAEKDGKLSYLIGPTVFYAVYVALGTSRVVARPFHLLAADRLAADIDDGFFSPEDIGL